MKTTLFLIPLEIFYECFRRVLPLRFLSLKVEFFRRVSFLKDLSLSDLHNFASFVEKRRVLAEENIVE